MEIKILQGLNNEYTGTTIKAKLYGEIKSNILDRIQSFHPIFMDGYTIKNDELVIQSKLPHLWVEIASSLQKLSKGDWSLDYTEKYILETIIKKQISSMSTIPILHSAMNQGLEITQFFLKSGISEDSDLNRRYIIGCGIESNQICSFSSSKDTYLGFMIQRDKTLTNSIMNRLGIPSPKWAEITKEEDIDDLWDSFTKPIVMKPAGLTGGNGVITRIESKEVAHKAYHSILEVINNKPRQKYQYKVLIQEQVSGEDYRLLVINGKFEIATKRIPAYIIGDGVNSIKGLIESLNKDPKRDITNPSHTLKPINIDDDLIDFLASQNLTVETIPQKEQLIYVRKVASMSKGGTTEDFTDKVSEQIKNLVETLASSIHAYALGVDVFCKDISKPLTPDNGAILECNTMPEAYLNSFPAKGKQYNNIGDIFLSGLIGKQKTKRILIIGGTTKEAQTLVNLKLDTNTERIGLYSDTKIIIDRDIFNNNIDIKDAFEALKLNASISTIVHHLSKDEFINNGSGFERIDLCLINKEENEIMKTMEGYKNLNLINDISTF